MVAGGRWPVAWLAGGRWPVAWLAGSRWPVAGGRWHGWPPVELQEPIYKEGKRQRGVVMCQIVAEPKTLQALHVVRWCGRGCEGKGVKYWCGFLERPVMIRQHRVLVTSEALAGRGLPCVCGIECPWLMACSYTRASRVC